MPEYAEYQRYNSNKVRASAWGRGPSAAGCGAERTRKNRSARFSRRSTRGSNPSGHGAHLWPGCATRKKSWGKPSANTAAGTTLFLLTKLGLDWTTGGIERNSSRGRILKEFEDSLRRLQTDYIDIYQVHWPDTVTPIEETAGTLRELFEQGKIRAIGVSNYSPTQMDRFRAVSPLHTAQPMLLQSFLRGRLRAMFCRMGKQLVHHHAYLWGHLPWIAERHDEGGPAVFQGRFAKVQRS